MKQKVFGLKLHSRRHNNNNNNNKHDTTDISITLYFVIWIWCGGRVKCSAACFNVFVGTQKKFKYLGTLIYLSLTKNTSRSKRHVDNDRSQCENFTMCGQTVWLTFDPVCKNEESLSLIQTSLFVMGMLTCVFSPQVCYCSGKSLCHCDGVKGQKVSNKT